MDLRLTGQTAMVTASSAGIGFAIAKSLAREGATVAINGRSRQSVEAAIAELKKDVAGASLIPLVADCGTAGGCAQAIRELPELDILINNLGIYESVDFFDITDEAWLRLFEVNILSGVRLSRYYLKRMLEKRYGRVLFVSSESAISPAPEMVHYSATKAMQLSVSRSLAELTRGTGVTVNVILPGSTKTEGVGKFLEQVFPGMDAEAGESRFMAENRPTSLIQRLINPDELGDFIAYVASPLASAINGAALRIDGGLVRAIF